MSLQHFYIEIQGIVQGVGFRPYIFRLAQKLKLKGYVNNTSNGVTIEIEGEADLAIQFIENIKLTPPPLSNISSIKFKEGILKNYTDFTIRTSQKEKENITLISPDLSICSNCVKDIHGMDNIRYRYPFTTCTDCGPRFSIIKAIPYDRENTTMNNFKMCASCLSEYKNPYDRRFHAETNACSKCGPRLILTDNKNNEISTPNPIQFAIKKLKAGYIFVLKGLCGFHLVCDGENEQAVALLRKRKNRPDKPFAVMMKDIDTVNEYCLINASEKEMLTGSIKPILILKQKMNCKLPDNIAPFQNTLGTMLPYTPLHYMLFYGGIKVLVMTSANISSFPLEYKNAAAVKNLAEITDYFLMHNREIETALDDSVVRYIAGKIRVIRRARGFVPVPVSYKSNLNIFACGADMKNTFSFTKDNYIFTSQYNGDLQNLETMKRYRENINHFKCIFNFEEQNIVHDLHPAYYSTMYANNELASHTNTAKTGYFLVNASSKKISVQHHHAHIASCMAENNVQSKVIGIAYDGTGYGTDNTIWGGEFLLCDYKSFKRLGHISCVKMPGGDLAVKEPWRMAAAYIFSAYEYQIKSLQTENEIEALKTKYYSLIKNLYNEKGLALFKLLQTGFKCYTTSSIGRLFDAAASIIGIRQYITYEGQASIELESVLDSSCKAAYSYKIESIDAGDCIKYIINTSPVILGLINDKTSNLSKAVMSAKFHNTVINFTIEMCKILRNNTGENVIALSGGVFQNSFILKNLIIKLEGLNFTVFSHESYPCNDGGISLGQIVIANAVLNKN